METESKEVKTIYTSGIVPYTQDGRIALQRRSARNRKNNEDWAFFGGRRDRKKNGELETAEEAMLREASEELKLTPTIYDHIGSVLKDQDRQTCVQDTYMMPVQDVSRLSDHEGLGVGVFTIEQARQLRMNPGDHLVLDQITIFFGENNIGTQTGDHTAT